MELENSQNKHSHVGKGSLPNRKYISQKEVNNKIHITCSDLYRKLFLNFDSPETLPQYRPIPLESSSKFLDQSNDWIWSYAQ